MIHVAEVIRVAAVVAYSSEFGDEWCESITVSRIFFDGEMAKRGSICICPTRAKKSGVLVRTDWDLPCGHPALPVLNNLLRLELGPFIEGVGDIITNDLQAQITCRPALLDEQPPVVARQAVVRRATLLNPVR